MHPVSPNRNRPPTASEGRRERERRKQDQQIIEDHSERIWKYTENEILKLIQVRGSKYDPNPKSPHLSFFYRRLPPFLIA